MFRTIEKANQVPTPTPIRSAAINAGFPEAKAMRAPIVVPIIAPALDFAMTAPKTGGRACAAPMAKTIKLITESLTW